MRRDRFGWVGHSHPTGSPWIRSPSESGSSPTSVSNHYYEGNHSVFMRILRLFLIVTVFLLLASPALAHVPAFPDENSTPRDAVDVPDPVKSWSFYDALGAGQVTYYRATLQPGQRLAVGTFTPRQDGFTPSLVVMSHAVNASGVVPADVTVPGGMNAVVVQGERPGTASYEPFTPSANYHTARFEHEVGTERTYLIAVSETANRTGPVGVTVGYEEAFSTREYLTVPFDLVRTHLWAGQSPLLVLGPFLATVLAGLGVARRRWNGAWQDRPIRIALTGAGLLLVGTSVNTAVQLGIALLRTGLRTGALVTVVFVAIPAAGGIWAVWRGLAAEFGLTPRRRLGLAVTGGLALLTWAGFIVGPAVLIGLAVLPARVSSS